MESEIKKTVRDVCSAAEKLKINVVLIGALVAEYTPEIGSDYPKFRGTNDADFAIAVRDWEAYKELREELLKREFKPNPRVEHRLHRGETMVDLIPYGSQIAPDGKLNWPESGMQMTVTGFDEVCAAARKAGRPDAPDLPVITIPGFVLLKIIAYLERNPDPKSRDDGRDIEYWLRNFASGSHDTRRYDLAELSGIAHEDYETAGAVLLGTEVGKLASPEAAVYVDQFIRESEDIDSPFMNVMAYGQFEEAADKKRREGSALLAAFKKGYAHERP
ncbi:MAG: hypothetical protein AAB262_09370 [Elusimicrobiota bacterium]